MTGVSGAAASSGGGAARYVAVSPGPLLAAELAATDTGLLDDHDLLEYLAAAQRLGAWVASLELGAAADFARRPARVERADDDPDAVRAAYRPVGDWVREFADDELAARLRVSRRAASTTITTGCALARLPLTRAALGEGRIDLGRARVIAEELAALDPGTAREVEQTVIGYAERQPAARLRPRVRLAAIAADSVAASSRGRRALSERRVVITPAADGMADLYAHLPALEALAIDTALSAAARASRAARAPGDGRTMDQRRADLLVAPFLRALDTGALDTGALDGSAQGGAVQGGTAQSGAGRQALGKHRGRAATLLVTVAASTLLGHDDAPAQLDGYGPITADVVRGLAPDARWQRILTDPRSGTVLDVGTTTYRPPADLGRHVETRDQRCTYPGCGWPAHACELDHTVPFPEGPTSATNLGARCRRHHRLKHSAVVAVTQHPDGLMRWTMPTGHVYDVAPPDLAPPLGAAAHPPSAPADDPPADTTDTATEKDTDADPRGSPP